MTFITGKHIPRRAFLRGMRTVVSLPLLDAMIPAGRVWADTAKRTDKTRLIAIEAVHGVAGCSTRGAELNLWSPAAVGRTFTLETYNALAPIEKAGFRDYLTIVSDTDVRMAESYRPAELGGDHFRSSAVFLTQSHPKQTRGSDVFAASSMDQLYAQRFGQDTPIPSMQLCIENVDQSGGCAYGYTCIYTDTISWASPTEPLPMIRDPRVVFEQLFGAGVNAKDRAARMESTGSILDWLLEETLRLKRSLGAADQRRMDQYLDNVREIERRIQLTVERSVSGEPREIPEAPPGVPDSFREHMEIMFDLQVLAFQADVTRVFSFKTCRDGSARVYPESGVLNGFHPLSHHGNREEVLLNFNLVNQYHVSLLPYLLEKLKNVEEGDTNLLEKTLVIYGSPMADGNLHNHRRCPLILLGGANGYLKGGVHFKAPTGTPMANVMLSLLHGLGFDDMESFGDSTGAFSFSSRTGSTAVRSS